jgi:transcriptional regulator of arginine metabolism
MSKLARQSVIRALVERRPVANQDELRRQLEKQGFEVTQATLSRDVNELGLMKGPEGYLLPGSSDVAVEAGPSVESVLRNFAISVKQAQNLLVLKTSTSSAQPVAMAVDNEDWKEVVGTVGGDDTVLIICVDNRAAERVKERIEEQIL